QVIAETNDIGQALKTYLYGDDLISQSSAGQTHSFHYDGLGSTRLLSDAAGNVSDSYSYAAFGELLNSSGETDNAYLFTGEQYDDSVDNYYLRARYYNPEIGRFTRQDEWLGRDSEPVTLNKYLYANSDGANWIDPSGYFSLQETMTVIRGSNILVNLGIRGAAKTQGKQLVWNGVCFAVENIAASTLQQSIQHLKGVYVFHDTDIGKDYVGQGKGKSGIVGRLKAHLRDLRTNTNRIIGFLPVTIQKGAKESLSEILDSVEQQFIEDLEGPGGNSGQKGNSANKRNQFKGNEKLNKLMKKLKFC
ncbi:hypothetical protein ORJ04_21570, partial [Rheinheimera baltica]